MIHKAIFELWRIIVVIVSKLVSAIPSIGTKPQKGRKDKMYKTGDYVVHTADGLCLITNISTLDIPDCDKEKKYYFLTPTDSPNSRVYVAVGSGDKSLREPISEREALELIDSIPTIDEITVENEKQRSSEYCKALVTNDCHELIRLLKTTYERKAQRVRRGRSATSVDEHYLKSATHALYGELSYALGVQEDTIPELIQSRIDV